MESGYLTIDAKFAGEGSKFSSICQNRPWFYDKSIDTLKLAVLAQVDLGGNEIEDLSVPIFTFSSKSGFETTDGCERDDRRWHRVLNRHRFETIDSISVHATGLQLLELPNEELVTLMALGSNAVAIAASGAPLTSLTNIGDGEYFLGVTADDLKGLDDALSGKDLDSSNIQAMCLSNYELVFDIHSEENNGAPVKLGAVTVRVKAIPSLFGDGSPHPRDWDKFGNITSSDSDGSTLLSVYNDFESEVRQAGTESEREDACKDYRGEITNDFDLTETDEAWALWVSLKNIHDDTGAFQTDPQYTYYQCLSGYSEQYEDLRIDLRSRVDFDEPTTDQIAAETNQSIRQKNEALRKRVYEHLDGMASHVKGYAKPSDILEDYFSDSYVASNEAKAHGFFDLTAAEFLGAVQHQHFGCYQRLNDNESNDKKYSVELVAIGRGDVHYLRVGFIDPPEAGLRIHTIDIKDHPLQQRFLSGPGCDFRDVICEIENLDGCSEVEQRG